jgi:hypothetical protein
LPSAVPAIVLKILADLGFTPENLRKMVLVILADLGLIPPTPATPEPKPEDRIFGEARPFDQAEPGNGPTDIPTDPTLAALCVPMPIPDNTPDISIVVDAEPKPVNVLIPADIPAEVPTAQAEPPATTKARRANGRGA